MAHVEPGDARDEYDERRKRDCLGCGVCENCIDRAMDYAIEQEMQIECPFCDGTGETNSAVDVNGRVTFDCPECGGTGWE